MKEKLELFGNVITNAELKKYTTYKTGGQASFLIKPSSIDNLIKLIKLLNNENINYFILGNGSNVIISDRNYDGVVINMNSLNNYEINDLILNAESGVFLPKLSIELANKGYSNFEWAGGLPGTIGGSIYGNAGAYNVTISDNLIDVTILKDNEVITLKKEEIKFGYRTSMFKENKDSIIISARFKLQKKEKAKILEIMKSRNKRRLESQPLDYPSAGSVFRNPNINDYKNLKLDNLKGNENGVISSWYLIESCNLKGFKIGGAKVSEKHANFIINDGNAKSEDIIKLIEYIKEKVYEKYKINLIEEQEIINYD